MRVDQTEQLRRAGPDEAFPGAEILVKGRSLARTRRRRRSLRTRREAGKGIVPPTDRKRRFIVHRCRIGQGVGTGGGAQSHAGAGPDRWPGGIAGGTSAAEFV